MALAQPMEQLLASGRGRSAPGMGFKAKVDGRWEDYASQCNRFLLEAYQAGCPSMRLNVNGHMYKFDFHTMEQKNLSTLDICEMKAPHNAQRSMRSSLWDITNLRHPRSKGRKAFRDTVRPQRPVFVVRVPENGPGTIIRVPHPKKLGKTMTVAVPAVAKVGQPLFVPMPRTQLETKVKYLAGGAVVGTTSAAAAVTISEVAGGAAAGGALATVGGVVAVACGGVVVVGAVVAAGVGVHYATRNPGKAAAIGALTIGGLALAAHISEVGVLDAAGDVAEGAGELLEGVGDVAEDMMDFAGDAVDMGEDGVDFIIDLF